MSVLAVANRIYFMGLLNRAFFWTEDRATLEYAVWLIAILAFVWLTPPDLVRDPTASGPGLMGLIASAFD